MAKISFLLGLVAGLHLLLSCALAVRINDVFTVKGTSGDGGCDHRQTLLDQWIEESHISAEVALDAMDEHKDDKRVIKALSTFFGLPNKKRLSPYHQSMRTYVRGNIEYIWSFLSNEKKEDGAPVYNKNDYPLFCNSDFLVRQNVDSTALDHTGKEIKDDDGKLVAIKDVSVYENMLSQDPKALPWWSRDLNGYYFDQDGGEFCRQMTNFGATAAIQLAGGDTPAGSDPPSEIATVILCPVSFDNRDKQNSYREANIRLAARVSLEDAIPKSATLLHEAFHAIRGVEILAGSEEKCMSNTANPQQSNMQYSVSAVC
ncbi:hypothetical protein PspLS_01910 [Pyricularia sp. CBS 133598]|nr:hypothetical protein PspLS_01910 [Pyricularia sp. CBS 133598]